MIDWRRMPGPGDEETWGPCTGHPMDPRTVDPTETAEFENMRDNMTIIRAQDTNGWFRESFSEAPDESMKCLSAKYQQMIKAGDTSNEAMRELGIMAYALMNAGCTPPDDEVIEALEPDEA